MAHFEILLTSQSQKSKGNHTMRWPCYVTELLTRIHTCTSYMQVTSKHRVMATPETGIAFVTVSTKNSDLSNIINYSKKQENHQVTKFK